MSEKQSGTPRTDAAWATMGGKVYKLRDVSKDIELDLARVTGELAACKEDAERIRKATIEECAKVAAELHCNCCWTEDAQIAADTIARDIRALAIDAAIKGGSTASTS